MNNIGSFLLTGLGVIVVGALVVGYLFFGSTDPSLEKKHLLLGASLNANRDEYAKCYNSINYGSTTVGTVSISYLMNYSVDRLHEIENAFMEQVNQKCEKPVADYEKEYKEFAELDEKLSTESGWKSFVFGGGNSPRTFNPNDLEPSTVRMTSGNPLTNVIFTKEEVEKFFQEKLAT